MLGLKYLKKILKFAWMDKCELSPFSSCIYIFNLHFLAKERNGCFHRLFSSFQSFQSKVYRTCPWYRDNRRKASEYLIELENTTFNILLSLHSADLEGNLKENVSLFHLQNLKNTVRKAVSEMTPTTWVVPFLKVKHVF